MAIKIITPNTNISTGSINTNFIKDAAVTTVKILDANVTVAKMAANSVDSDQYVDGSIDTAHIGDDQVTLAKISTTGASNEQVLTYNSTSGNIEWAANSDIDVSNITDKMKITQASAMVSPLLHLKTTNTGYDKGQILLEDSVDDAVSINGRVNDPLDRYSFQMVMDPNNTKPRTNVSANNPVVGAGSFVVNDKFTIKTAGNTDFTAIGSANNNVGTVFTATGVGSGTGTAYKGDGQVFAGDYVFSFSKKYADQDEIQMQLNVFGAHNGFDINSFDDANGGIDAYGWKPMRLGASDIGFNIESTERLAFDGNGMHVSGIPFTIGQVRGGSGINIEYTGASGNGDPDMNMYLYNAGDSGVNEVLKAWDVGATEATVSLGKTLSVGNKTSGTSNLMVLSDHDTASGEKGVSISTGALTAATGGMSGGGGFDIVSGVDDARTEFKTKIRLKSNNGAPGAPTAGDMYFDTSDNKFKGYDGSAWRNLH